MRNDVYILDIHKDWTRFSEFSSENRFVLITWNRNFYMSLIVINIVGVLWCEGVNEQKKLSQQKAFILEMDFVLYGHSPTQPQLELE